MITNKWLDKANHIYSQHIVSLFNQNKIQIIHKEHTLLHRISIIMLGLNKYYKHNLKIINKVLKKL